MYLAGLYSNPPPPPTVGGGAQDERCRDVVWGGVGVWDDNARLTKRGA